MSAALSALVALLAFAALFTRADAYDAFVKGAKEGLRTALRVAPCLCAIMPLCALLERCGVVQTLLTFLGPVLEAVGLPAETLPILLLRPLSGSASMGMLESTLRLTGPDSAAGRIASVICGANETVFYLCALYLGAAGVQKSRYILPAALAGYAAACLSAPLWCALFT